MQDRKPTKRKGILWDLCHALVTACLKTRLACRVLESSRLLKLTAETQIYLALPDPAMIYMSKEVEAASHV